MIKPKIFILVVLFLFGMTASMGAMPLRVVTSTTVFADMIQNVGGERVQVSSIVPIGGDPHTYDPTPREAREVASADIFFYNGLGLELWVQRLVRNAARPDLVKIVLSEGLTPIPGVSFAAHSHAEGDPHFWLDITNGMHYVRQIEKALSAYDPANEKYYREQSSKYLQVLDELDKWFMEQISQIPAERRILFTYHDAFAYMAKRYGLELAGSLVRNPDREPSSREMANLILSIRKANVSSIFAEPQINPRFIESLARETGVKVGILYSDALTRETPTYVDMMRSNAKALLEGLK